MLSKISLKCRLLSVGLLCAMLTGLTGAAGIISLQQIHKNMQDTTEEIGSIIDIQNLQVGNMIQLRSLVMNIDNAKAEEELDAIDQKLSKKLKDPRHEYRMISVSNLLMHKRRQIKAMRDVALLSRKNSDDIERITTCSLNIVDDTEFESTMSVNDAMEGIKGSFNELSVSTDEIHSAIKSTLLLRSYCLNIDSQIKAARLSEDKVFIQYIRTEIKTLFEKAEKELASLSQSTMVANIYPKIKELKGIIEDMFELKDVILAKPGRPGKDLSNQLEECQKKGDAVIGDISGVVLNVLDDTESNAAMKADTTKNKIKVDISQMADVAGKGLQKIKWSFSIRSRCNQLKAVVNETLSARDTDLINYKKSEVDTLLGNMRNELGRLSGDETAEEIKALLGPLENDISRMFEARNRMLSAEKNLGAAFEAIYKKMTEVDETILETSKVMKENANRTMKTSTGMAYRWQNLEVVLVCGAFLMAIVIGVFVSGSIVKQIQTLNDGIKVIGEGNLEYKVGTNDNDEIGQLSRAFDLMTDKLQMRESDLIESERRFRRLFALSNDGIVIHGLDTRVIDVNRQMAEMVGYSRDELLGISIIDHYVPGEMEKAEAFFGSIHQNKSVQMETRYVRADGIIINVDVRSSIVDEEEGIAQTVVRDITKRKKDEEELRRHMDEVSKANHRLEVLVANTTDREKKMVELKQEVNMLMEAMGKEKKYKAPREVIDLLER